mmetsp:Transcript_26601/g.57687  ORF Transcript_26601/g.57687 Transcript_26601/m.57687 type:complete len:206 (-) Transcript_26601:18-635(-)
MSVGDNPFKERVAGLLTNIVGDGSGHGVAKVLQVAPDAWDQIVAAVAASNHKPLTMRLCNVVGATLDFCPDRAAASTMADKLSRSRALTRITSLITTREPPLACPGLQALCLVMGLLPPAALQRVVATGVIPHVVALADPPSTNSPAWAFVLRSSLGAITVLAQSGDRAAKAALRKAGAVEALERLRTIGLPVDVMPTLAALNSS